MSRQNIPYAPNISALEANTPAVQMPSDTAMQAIDGIAKTTGEIAGVFKGMQEARDKGFLLDYQNEVIEYNSNFAVNSANRVGSNAYNVTKDYEDGLKKIYQKYADKSTVSTRNNVYTFYNRELSKGKTKYGLYEAEQATVARNKNFENFLGNLSLNTRQDSSNYDDNLALAASYIQADTLMPEEQKVALLNSSVNQLSMEALEGDMDKDPYFAIKKFEDGGYAFTGTNLSRASNFVSSNKKKLQAEVKAQQNQEKMMMSIEKQSIKMRIDDFLKEKIPVPMGLMTQYVASGASEKEVQHVEYFNDRNMQRYADEENIASLSFDEAEKFVDEIEDPIRKKEAEIAYSKYVDKVNKDPVAALDTQINQVMEKNNMSLGQAISELQKQKGLNPAKIRFFSENEKSMIRHQIDVTQSGDERYQIVKDVVDKYGIENGQSAMREVFDEKYVLAYTLAGNNPSLAGRYMSVVGVDANKYSDNLNAVQKNIDKIKKQSVNKNNIVSYLRSMDNIYGTSKYFKFVDLMASYCARYDKKVEDAIKELGENYGAQIYADDEIVSDGYTVTNHTFSAKKEMIKQLLKSKEITSEQATSIRKGSFLVITGGDVILTNKAGIPLFKTTVDELKSLEEGDKKSEKEKARAFRRVVRYP